MCSDFLEEVAASLPPAPVLALVKALPGSFILRLSTLPAEIILSLSPFFFLFFFLTKSDENQRGSRHRSATGFVVWKTSGPKC